MSATKKGRKILPGHHSRDGEQQTRFLGRCIQICSADFHGWEMIVWDLRIGGGAGGVGGGGKTLYGVRFFYFTTAFYPKKKDRI